MRAIGFRATAEDVRWSVVEGTTDQPTLVDQGKIRPPRTYNTSQSLAYYREQVQVLVKRMSVDAGAVRHTEPKARAAARPRARIEGVLEEALYSAGVRKLVCGPLATIGSAMRSRKPKAYLSADDLRGIDLDSVSGGPKSKEAVLAAVAALGAK